MSREITPAGFIEHPDFSRELVPLISGERETGEGSGLRMTERDRKQG